MGAWLRAVAVLVVFFLAQDLSAQERKQLRAGIIGLDTSHVTAFTQIFNDPKATGDVALVKVVAAYPGGSPDIASSRDRIDGFTNKLRDMGVEIVDSIPRLLERVDVVLLESVDGRPHLERLALPRLGPAEHPPPQRSACRGSARPGR